LAERKSTVNLRSVLATGRSFEDLKFTKIFSPQAHGRTSPQNLKFVRKVLREECWTFHYSRTEGAQLLTLFIYEFYFIRKNSLILETFRVFYWKPGT
jgi:hypothetical protein